MRSTKTQRARDKVVLAAKAWRKTRLIVEKKLDLVACRVIIKTFMGAYAAEDFDSVVSEVLWKKSRGTL